MLEDYTRNFYGPVKLGNLALVSIQATVAGGSGAPTRDATASSPGTTIARASAGQYTITFPPGQVLIPLTAETVLAEQLGSRGYWEAFDADAGTGALEFAKTPGTAAEVEDDTRICIAFLIGKN